MSQGGDRTDGKPWDKAEPAEIISPDGDGFAATLYSMVTAPVTPKRLPWFGVYLWRVASRWFRADDDAGGRMKIPHRQMRVIHWGGWHRWRHGSVWILGKQVLAW